MVDGAVDKLDRANEEVGSMTQWANAGLPFNPVGNDGQGRVYQGQNVHRLRAAMLERGIDDPRFVTAAQARGQGWSVRVLAEPVKVFFREHGGQPEDRSVYSAVDVDGMPSLAEMLKGPIVTAPLPFPAISAAMVDAVGEAAPGVVSAAIEDTAVVPPVGLDERLEAEAAVPGVAMSAVAEEDESLEVLPIVVAEEEEDELIIAPAKRLQLVSSGDGRSMGVAGAGVEDVAPAPDRAAVAGVPATLLGGKFVRDEDGCYWRDMALSPSLEDRGSSLVIRDKKPDAYEALFELAAAKGWTEIELKGKAAFKPEAWLQAQLRGITVANYSPTKEDVARLESVRKDLAEKEAARLAAALLETPGRNGVTFKGTVLKVTDTTVEQNAGRGETVTHSLALLDRTPEKGSFVDIKYSGGKGVVVDRALGQSAERSAGR